MQEKEGDVWWSEVLEEGRAQKGRKGVQDSMTEFQTMNCGQAKVWSWLTVRFLSFGTGNMSG